MKIALVYQKFVSSGGLEGYLFRLARELRDAGHELQVLTGETDAETEALGLEITKVSLPKSKTRALLAFERAALEKGAELPVDVHLGFGRTSYQDIHRAGAGCHAAYLPILNPLKRAGFKSKVELALEKDLYTSGHTKHFVVNSELIQQQLIEHYQVAEEKFSIIRTAVDTEHFKPTEDAASRAATRQQYGVEDDRPVLLFVSRAHRRKGLPALLAAWPGIAAKTGAQLWIAGPKIDRFIKELPAEFHDSVTHLDQVEDMAPVYAAADRFIHPTLYDACANTVLQSMACGLPGIISTRDGASEFIDSGVNGWTLDTPDDPACIETTVLDALEDKDRASLGKAARERVLPLTWQAHIADWERVIGQLAS